MEVNLVPKQPGVRGSLLHIHLETNYPKKKQILEEALEQKKFEVFLKRVFDIFISLLLIISLSPILIVIAILVKLTSAGPVLYSNERVGYRGIHFRCFKFRSMVIDQSIKKDDYEVALSSQEKGVLHKVKNDTRITWIGKIIRKTSIDELPQLLNVLRGDMSIIGPRPLVPFMLKNLPEFREIRCLMRPGITGLWQIRDRINNISAEFMIEHDIEYVENFSLLLDMKILFKTPIVVINAEGAY